MADLLERLSNGDHPVVASRVISPQDLKSSIERGYVIIKFTDTKGETELRVKLNQDQTDLADVKFTDGQGQVKLSGTLILNSVKVCCHAVIELTSLSGRGYLEILE
jgi:hypothetical protein